MPPITQTLFFSAISNFSWSGVFVFSPLTPFHVIFRSIITILHRYRIAALNIRDPKPTPLVYDRLCSLFPSRLLQLLFLEVRSPFRFSSSRVLLPFECPIFSFVLIRDPSPTVVIGLHAKAPPRAAIVPPVLTFFTPLTQTHLRSKLLPRFPLRHLPSPSLFSFRSSF